MENDFEKDIVQMTKDLIKQSIDEGIALGAEVQMVFEDEGLYFLQTITLYTVPVETSFQCKREERIAPITLDAFLDFINNANNVLDGCKDASKENSSTP